MTIQQTLTCAADKACDEAVHRFASELQRLTSLHISLVAGEADIAIDGEETTDTLVAHWTTTDEDTSDTPAADDDRPEEGDSPDQTAGRNHLVEHYARALDALARNPLAARAFLDRVH